MAQWERQPDSLRRSDSQAGALHYKLQRRLSLGASRPEILSNSVHSEAIQIVAMNIGSRLNKD